MPRRRRWLIGLALAGLVVFGPGAVEWVRLSIQQQQLDRRLATLQVQHEWLTQEQVRLQSDPTYVEGLIRTTFKVAKPGEYVIPLDSAPRRD